MAGTGLFEKAARRKLRINLRGTITPEQLWDIHEKELDTFYGCVVEDLEKFGKRSILKSDGGRKTNEELDLRLTKDLLEHVIITKSTERKAREDAKANRELKQRLLAIKQQRQLNAYDGMSDDALDKEIAKLEE